MSGEPQRRSEALTFEEALGRLGDMIGHTVSVSIGFSADPLGTPMGSRPLQAVGTLGTPIEGQGEISRRRPDGNDLVTFQLDSSDTGVILTLEEGRLTEATIERLAADGPGMLVLTLGPLRVVVENVDELRAH